MYDYISLDKYLNIILW